MTLALADMRIYHEPVMVREVMEALQAVSSGTYIDCTVGEGGHAEAVLEVSSPGGRVIGLDADPNALKTAEWRLEKYRDAISLVNASYVDLLRVAHRHSALQVEGVLMDLGISSMQLEASGRGFSFLRDEPLDMRYSSFEGITASEVVNGYSWEKLANIIFRYGDEKRSRHIARVIVQNRPIGTSAQLALVVKGAIRRGRSKIHPATKTFQAIRIEVNGELQNLSLGLGQAIDVLAPRGRLVVISYHSLEDRLVKEVFRRESSDCICPPSSPICRCGHKATLRIVNKKVITPSPAEVMVNPRSRSARLRVAERV